MSGLNGNDTLLGQHGDDRLIGGPGNDVIDGGLGIDSIVYNEFGLSNQDTIKNYVGTGADGDIIDLSALLNAVFDPGEDITDFVKVTDTGDNALIQIDAAGSSNFDATGNIATLVGYGTFGNIVSVYLDGAELQVQVSNPSVFGCRAVWRSHK